MTSRRFLAFAFVVFAPAVARADEGGVPFWMSGQYASLAAVPATPGLYLPVVGYFYYGKASADESFTRGEAIAVGIKSRLPLLLIQPTFAPKPKIAGGQLAVGVGWGFGQSWTKADVSLSPTRGMEESRTDTVLGISDLYPVVSLAWGGGQSNSNAMVYLTGDVPIGSYDSKRLSNIGIGHGAVDAGGGYTYLDQKKGHEASAVAGLTYNLENTSTNYKNGLDSHIDWALSQFLSNHLDVGVVGYFYYQLTGDTGSGAKLGSFRSAVASVGAQGIWVFSLAGVQGSFNLRGYWEFWAQNRLKGVTAFGTLVIPLFGWPKPPAAAGSQ